MIRRLKRRLVQEEAKKHERNDLLYIAITVVIVFFLYLLSLFIVHYLPPMNWHENHSIHIRFNERHYLHQAPSLY